MKQFILFCCLFLPALLAAQACDYDKLFREGKTFAKQRQYKKALYKYNSARRCDPAKGEAVDAAIEALLDQVEGEKRTVDKALEDLRQASGKVVESLLHDAETEIYHLRYNGALNILNAAAEIGQRKPDVARLLMEIAYFNAESGHFSKASDNIATVAKLLGKEAAATQLDTIESPATRRAFRKTLQNLDPIRYAELESRYYPVMIDVKGGAFILGCGPDMECDTMPHLMLSDFQLDRTETTFWRYALYAAATNKNIQKLSPDWGLDGDNPVVKVNWFQVVEYANWLSVQQGLQPAYSIKSRMDDFGLQPVYYYRDKMVERIRHANGYCLPSDIEWEYAARGGNSSDNFLYSGSDDLSIAAWYSDNSDTLGVKRSHPVSTRKPNGLGLTDMSGNVWEWCWDVYDQNQAVILDYPDAPPPGNDCIVRGGSWAVGVTSCPLTIRYKCTNDEGTYDLGFRLARH